MGLKGHKPDCACPACQGHAASEERRAREAEQAATVRAVARALVRMAAAGPLSGPDTLRNLVGRDDALRVLRAAGMNPAQTAASWQADTASQQVSTQFNSGGDPDHDPRVIELLVSGAPDAELARVRAEVQAEYRERAAGRAAGQQSRVLWRTRDGGGGDGRHRAAGRVHGACRGTCPVVPGG